jgi:hypothetical protein
VDLEEPALGEERPGAEPVGGEGRDEGAAHDASLLEEQAGDLAGPADVLLAVAGAEAEVAVHDRHDHVGDAQQRRNEAVALRLCQHALARVDQDDGAFGCDAPVTILRVYWRWPGVSAMMNLRFGVAK